MNTHTIHFQSAVLSTCFMTVVKMYSKATEKPLRAELVSCPHGWGLKGIFLTAQGKFLVPLAV